MKKYILIASILLANNAFAQLIIGDLMIEPTEKSNKIKITNISSKPIDKIIMDGKLLPENMRVLQPNKSITFIFNPEIKKQLSKEEKAFADLLKDH